MTRRAKRAGDANGLKGLEKNARHEWHQSYLSFVERGKAKMCALGAIMHKIIRVAFGVLKHETPFVKNFAKLEA